MEEEKKKLQDSYDNVTEEVFQDAEEYVINPKPKDWWNLTNEMVGRKSSKLGIIRPKDKKDSINKWYVHFENMLGPEPVVKEGLEEYIEAILNNFMIPDCLCTKEKYTKVKNELNG